MELQNSARAVITSCSVGVQSSARVALLKWSFFVFSRCIRVNGESCQLQTGPVVFSPVCWLWRTVFTFRPVFRTVPDLASQVAPKRRMMMTKGCTSYNKWELTDFSCNAFSVCCALLSAQLYNSRAVVAYRLLLLFRKLIIYFIVLPHELWQITMKQKCQSTSCQSNNFVHWKLFSKYFFKEKIKTSQFIHVCSLSHTVYWQTESQTITKRYST